MRNTSPGSASRVASVSSATVQPAQVATLSLVSTTSLSAPKITFCQWAAMAERNSSLPSNLL